MGLIPEEIIQAVKIKQNKIDHLKKEFKVKGISLEEFKFKIINNPGKYLITPDGILFYYSYDNIDYDYHKSKDIYSKMIKEVNPDSFIICSVSGYNYFSISYIYNKDPSKSSEDNIEDVIW